MKVAAVLLATLFMPATVKDRFVTDGYETTQIGDAFLYQARSGSRASGTNPRALRTNPRAQGTNPRAQKGE